MSTVPGDKFDWVEGPSDPMEYVGDKIVNYEVGKEHFFRYINCEESIFFTSTRTPEELVKSGTLKRIRV